MLFRNQKLNKLLIGAIVVGMAVPLLNVFVFYPHFYNQITSSIEDSAIRLTKHMKKGLWHGGWSVIFDGGELTADGKQLLDTYLDDFDLSKMKIFTREGVAIYSTEAEDIGKINENSYFINFVSKGKVFSKVVKKETKSLEGQIYEEDIVEVYVPLLDGREFAGAFELYYNVTEQISSLDRHVFNASILPFGVSAFLLFALYWGFWNLDRSLIEKEMVEQEVRTLQGIIPICMHCKKIRDDKGSWNQLEAYIESHSDAQFSHGLCERCLREHYGNEMADSISKKKTPQLNKPTG